MQDTVSTSGVATQRNFEASGHRPIYDLLAHPKAVKVLPSLQAIVSQLEQAAKQKDVPVHEISRLVRLDQSLAVRIIRLANSAAFSPGEPIVDLDEAIIYLGLANVRSIIITTRCIENVANVPSGLIHWNRFWAHSVAVGHTARVLAGFLRAEHQPSSLESLYIAGLLHDIGKLALACLSPSDFEEVVTTATARSCPLAPVEIELIGMDHGALGAWYLQSQGLPESITESVRRHHCWQDGEDLHIPGCLISLADRFSHLLQVGESGSAAPAGALTESPEWEVCVQKLWRPQRSGTSYSELLHERLANLSDIVGALLAK